MNWQAEGSKDWGRLSRRLQTTDPSLQILVLAAHPDDETIGASVLLSRFPQSSVVFLTDGAPRDTRLWSAGVHGSREDYAETRRQEALDALKYVNIPAEQVVWLGAVDQESAFEIGTLAERFGNVITETRPEIVITHAYEGGHPDHDAASLAVSVACGLIEARGGSVPAIIEMTGYHADGRGLATGVFLPSQHPVTTLTLTAVDRLRKKRMIDCFASQRELLAGFAVETESFREAPQYDFREPPPRGAVHYERLGWKINGALWRQQTRLALDRLGSPACPRG